MTIPSEPEPPRTTVNEIAERYWQACERRVTRGRLKAYTLYRNKRIWALHIESNIGGLAYVDMSDDDISEWVDAG